jgi:hypothetical protein
MPTKFNARGEVTIPFFVVGEPDPDLNGIVETLDAVRQANRKPIIRTGDTK